MGLSPIQLPKSLGPSRAEELYAGWVMNSRKKGRTLARQTIQPRYEEPFGSTHERARPRRCPQEISCAASDSFPQVWHLPGMALVPLFLFVAVYLIAVPDAAKWAAAIYVALLFWNNR